jgi:hypothetical protein
MLPCIHVICSLHSHLFYPEDGGNRFLSNVSVYPPRQQHMPEDCNLSISRIVHPCMDRVNTEALMTNSLESTENEMKNWEQTVKRVPSVSRWADPMPRTALWRHKHFILYLYSSSVAKTWVLYMKIFISSEISWNKKQMIENSVYTTESSICTNERVNKKSCHMDCGRTTCMSVMQTHCKLTKTQYFATCCVPYCQEPLFYSLLYSLFFAWMNFIIETTEFCHQEWSEICILILCFECIAFIYLAFLLYVKSISCKLCTTFSFCLFIPYCKTVLKLHCF